ncbi:nucleoside deaminase [Arcticibacter eurypsychrophilus]|uniref:nucleoside deaminase n=1 Tax=Arcticibacter eurypsychrophilus TaxID=1434752 RepID=UPI00084DA51D|nr:nucleoside deaminase [Arcticibacter eurypsychrophilus]
MEENVHHQFMRMAISYSRSNILESLGGPFGAVIVKDNSIIAASQNLVLSTNDPTAHAEISAIRKACQLLKTYDLSGCIIYTSCEPCPMCLGAIYWARLAKIYYANTKHDAAVIGFDDHFIYEELELVKEQRQLPSEQILEDEAKVVFDLWVQSEKKMRY